MDIPEEFISISVLSTLAGLLYGLLIIGFTLAIIVKRRPVGVSLAWLLLLFILPLAGMVLFLTFGTRRLGHTRLQRAKAVMPAYNEWFEHLKQVLFSPHEKLRYRHNRVYNLASHITDIPPVPGNQVVLFHETGSIFKNLIKDIQQARESIFLEFYICENGGRMDQVIDALVQAARRGIDCRILLDAVGSKDFLASPGAARLKAAGIIIRESLPVGFVRMLFERIDLRNHRKLLVIDDEIFWTGSFNLADPVLFKQSAGVGQWIDAMTRLQGPVAHVGGAIFTYDWEMETGDGLKTLRQKFQYDRPPIPDSASIHVVPSGPGLDRTLIHQVLLAAIYESTHELIITSPYFVPDEALQTALCSAASRGVNVILILPERNDSRLVYYASRAYYDDLLKAGVRILHFTEGLLHTKCVLVDRETVLFGSVNMDMRSVWLNFELTMIFYGERIGQQMAVLTEDYISRSKPVSLAEWEQRTLFQRLRENSAQLLSPLL